jgi:hypothetical protein
MNQSSHSLIVNALLNKAFKASADVHTDHKEEPTFVAFECKTEESFISLMHWQM